MLRVTWLLEVFLICHDWDSVEPIFNAWFLPCSSANAMVDTCGSTSTNRGHLQCGFCGWACAETAICWDQARCFMDFAWLCIFCNSSGKTRETANIPFDLGHTGCFKIQNTGARFTKQSKQRPLRNPILPDMKPDILSYSFSTWTWSAMRLGRVNFMWCLAEVTAAHSGEVLLPL